MTIQKHFPSKGEGCDILLKLCDKIGREIANKATSNILNDINLIGVKEPAEVEAIYQSFIKKAFRNQHTNHRAGAAKFVIHSVLGSEFINRIRVIMHNINSFGSVREKIADCLEAKLNEEGIKSSIINKIRELANAPIPCAQQALSKEIMRFKILSKVYGTTLSDLITNQTKSGDYGSAEHYPVGEVSTTQPPHSADYTSVGNSYVYYDDQPIPHICRILCLVTLSRTFLRQGSMFKINKGITNSQILITPLTILPPLPRLMTR